jgi:hypothetical protein
LEDHLRVLKKLFDEGFITNDEYETRKKKLLDEEFGEPGATDNPDPAT